MLTFWIRRRPADRGGARLRARPAAAPAARRSGPTVREANLAVLRGQRQRHRGRRRASACCRRTHASRRWPSSPRAPRRISPPPPRRRPPRPRRPWAMAAVFAVLIPGRRASGFYLWVGAPAATDPARDGRGSHGAARRPPDRGDGRRRSSRR
ncbi:MAG: hypothetical protein MZW92_36115 [Comamonadaceae bacterium]|nr:hypothetical protein [Comamonadaceae bacterium]